jgi:hypothetical protein
MNYQEVVAVFLELVVAAEWCCVGLRVELLRGLPR